VPPKELALQNIQARLRMVAFSLAQLLRGEFAKQAHFLLVQDHET
jgi:NH3-dependent NAD+ synthetase